MDLDRTRSVDQPGNVSSFADRARVNGAPAFRTIADLIANGGPSMVFQPIVHIDTDRLLGAEALSRFPTALGTELGFELAVSVGLGAELEMSAARNALATVDHTTQTALGWEFVGINISPRTLLDVRFYELVAERVGPHIVIEVSDPRECTDWALLKRCVDRVRDLGCRVAVNSLTCDPAAQFDRLREVAPEIIKLDRSYTSTLIENHGRRRGIAEEFLRKCIKRGVFVVAVGVEQASDVAGLAELGVEAVQGYAFGKPQPIGCFRPGDTGTGGSAQMARGSGWI
jgi:EAL domain-containing protein (putative c-di-GMP-specific phosphodiesterase class I)